MNSSRSPFARIARVIGFGLVGVVVLIALAYGIAYAVSNSRLHKTHSVAARPISIPTTPEALAHGRHLAVTRGCNDCHAADFGGRGVIQDPKTGNIHASNITSGRGGLPKDYSDLDYVRAIRHGVTREGRPLVLMPSAEYTKLSDEDLGVLIAYMKTVPPVDRERGPVELGPILRVMLTLGEFTLSADVINHDEKQPVSVPVAASAEYGRYLASTCVGCHGENLSGGKIPGAPPDWPAAANLTPHASSRLPAWTEKDFFNALRTLKRPDGTVINAVMPAAFGQMNDLETTALWLYIKSVPAAATGERK